MFLESDLQNTIISLGAQYHPDIFHDLSAAYSEDGRHYHDQSHVSELLMQFNAIRYLAANPAEIETAIWFHDAIYDTRKPDNEEQSAAWAESFLTHARAPRESISRIVDIILATKSHQSDNPDALIMLDIDLGILGAPHESFEQYDQAIRKEYHWVPLEAYTAGRLQVLSTFYDRDRIFQTDHFHKMLETNARSNLRSKINELSTN